MQGDTLALPSATPLVTRADRMPEIDLLRGFAIIAVVGLHVSWFYVVPADLDRTPARAVALLHLLNGYGVPLFLALSAAGLSLRHAQPAGVRAHIEFLRRRALRLLPAYVLWSTVSAAAFRPETLLSASAFAKMLVGGTADGQFYFIPLLFEIYLLWPLLRPIARSAAADARAAWAIGALGIGISVLWWRLSGTGVVPRGLFFAPMFWLAYVGLGAAVVGHMPAVRRVAFDWRCLFGAALLSAAALCWTYRHFMGLIEPHYRPDGVLLAAMIFQISPCAYIVSVMSLLTLIAVRLGAGGGRRLLIWVGEQAYGVFLIHLLVLRLLLHPLLPPGKVTRLSVAGALGQTLLCWGLCLALSTGVVALLSRARWTRRLVSNR